MVLPVDEFGAMMCTTRHGQAVFDGQISEVTLPRETRTTVGSVAFSSCPDLDRPITHMWSLPQSTPLHVIVRFILWSPLSPAPPLWNYRLAVGAAAKA